MRMAVDGAGPGGGPTVQGTGAGRGAPVVGGRLVAVVFPVFVGVLPARVQLHHRDPVWSIAVHLVGAQVDEHRRGRVAAGGFEVLTTRDGLFHNAVFYSALYRFVSPERQGRFEVRAPFGVPAGLAELEPEAP